MTQLGTLAVLLVLSIATLYHCRRDLVPAKSEVELLFRGHSLIHSVVSSAGAIFSVTYFLGATFIYALIYRAWIFAVAIATLVLTLFLVRAILKAGVLAGDIEDASKEPKYQNLLLELLRRRLPPAKFRIFVWFQFAVFLLLLSEELAISRVVLHSILPHSAPLSGLIMFLICGVVFVYLYAGGFRAVLASDLVQGVVLAAFMLMLIFLTAKNASSIQQLTKSIEVPSRLNLLAALICWTAYGTFFLVNSIDFYSRLNFVVKRNGSRIAFSYSFLNWSILLIFVISILGITFGFALSGEIGKLSSASAYYRDVSAYFMSSDAAIVRMTFLTGIFCMIFTTLDTLLLSVVQIAQAAGSAIGAKRNMGGLLLTGVVCSLLIDANSVCAVGILIGSLAIPSAVLSLIAIGAPKHILVAGRICSLLPLIGVSAFIVFIRNIETLKFDFTLHYAIPGYFLVVTAIAAGSTFVRLNRSSK